MIVFVLLWWWISIGGTDAMNHYEDVTLSKYGALIHKTDSEVVVKNDGLILTFIYDTGELSNIWNNYIEKSEQVLRYIGDSNSCVNKLISNAKLNRNMMKNYTITLGFNFTEGVVKHKYKRTKRQIGLLVAGAISLAQFGFSQYEIHEINNAITKIKQNVNHNTGNIKVLDKAIKIISSKVKAVEHNELILEDEMGKLSDQLGELIKVNEQNAQDIACLKLTINFNKKENVVREFKHELENILDYHFNKDIIDIDLRKNVCSHIIKAGHETHGKCNNFDMIEIVDLVFVGKKLVMITKMPIKNMIDDFKLANIIALPVKVNDNFVKIKNIDMQIALGTKYMITLGKCKRFKNKNFCEGTSAFQSIKNNTNTCIGNILSQTNGVIEKCNFEHIHKMEDYFFRILGTYFFSVNRTITLELVCVESKDNARVSLQGLGSVIIKKGCMAKYDSILLVGSDQAKLNTSFEINLKNNQRDFMEINQKFSLINKLKDSRLPMQQINFNHTSDLIQIPTISPQDNYSLEIDSNIMIFIKVFLSFCCISSGLYIIKLFFNCFKLDCKLVNSNYKRKTKLSKYESNMNNDNLLSIIHGK